MSCAFCKGIWRHCPACHGAPALHAEALARDRAFDEAKKMRHALENRVLLRQMNETAARN